MQALFKEITALPGVRGVILISQSGEILYQHKAMPEDFNLGQGELRQVLETLKTLRESDLVFSSGRLYVRRTAVGYLLVVTGLFAQSAMIRLHCDILLPELANLKPKKKKRFFRR